MKNNKQNKKQLLQYLTTAEDIAYAMRSVQPVIIAGGDIFIEVEDYLNESLLNMERCLENIRLLIAEK